jgi:hypothetical protein
MEIIQSFHCLCYYLNMRTYVKPISIITLLLISSVFISQSSIQDSQGIPLRGTLVVPISCGNSVIMGADTRVIGQKGEDHFDSYQKIRPIHYQKMNKPSGMFAVMSIGVISDKNDPSPPINKKRLFDLNQAVTEFYYKNDPRDIDKNIGNLKDTLEQYTQLNFFANVDRNLLQEYVNNKDKPIYSLVIFSVNRKNKISAYIVNAHVIMTYQPLLSASILSLDMKVDKAPEGFFTKIIPIPMGNTDVAKEILDGKDPRFDEVRRCKEIVGLPRNSKPAKLSQKVAVEFIQWLIKESSEKAPLINAEPSVGPISDCAILTPGKGFKWLVKKSTTK